MAAADFSQIPMSPNLAATLARASEVAGVTAAGDVNLEHVLLALCDDPDADAVLMASHVDVARLKSETARYLGSLAQQAGGGGLGVAPALSRILEAAAAAARGGRRRDINGAIVLAAIVGDGKSAAAQILQAHGLTFDEAIRALQAALAAPARESLPDFRPADDVLARARERVQSRSAPGLRDIMNDRPRTALPPPSAPPVPMLPPPEHALEERVEVQPPEFAPPDVGVQAEPPAVNLPETAAVDVETVNPAVGTATMQQPGEYADREQFNPEERLPPQRVEPTLSAPQGYVYPAEHQPPPPAYAPPPPVSFDFARPVPIASPPPIPPPIPQWQPGPQSQHSQQGPANGPGYGGQPGFARGPEPSFAPPPPQAMPPQQGGGGYGQGHPPGQPQFEAPYGYPGGPYGHPNGPPMPGPPMPGPPMSQPQMRAPAMPPPAPAGSPPQPLKVQRAKVETGQLAENIPRGMRVGRTERVEVRIAKAAAKAITEGLEGGGVAWHHEVTVTQAMSVRLRAPDGGFFIESASPETQWIENQLGFASDDFASWRFLVTPQSRGWNRLQIIVSARTIGADGMAAETALPDQVVEVKVRTNYKRTLLRWTGWILAAIAGGALAKFGEGGLSAISKIIEKMLH
ncbi:MAG: Clp protease N-terminal domain-containing protein [Hyphomicrobium sp.]